MMSEFDIYKITPLKQIRVPDEIMKILDLKAGDYATWITTENGLAILKKVELKIK